MKPRLRVFRLISLSVRFTGNESNAGFARNPDVRGQKSDVSPEPEALFTEL
jgi:hypothetical protein